METSVITKKRVFLFGGDAREGNSNMKSILGGKGANLAEMSNLDIPVPPGFTVTTEVCSEYHAMGREFVVQAIGEAVEEGVDHMEKLMGRRFGHIEHPLLISVRSGARVSMPGMMDTVLNIGLNPQIVESLAVDSGDPRFAWDSYRRFIQMYGDVVMKVNSRTESEEDAFELILEDIKTNYKLNTDQELQETHLRELVDRYKEMILEVTGTEFPEDPWTQLWNGILAVFESWDIPRAKYYRKINGIPDDWGTAVNVQAMVFGNMGDNSCSGVAFTRNSATGEALFNGEYLVNAQGEDVVAGVRTPLQITMEGSRRWAALNGISEEDRASNYASLEEQMPAQYKELFEYQSKLEQHFKDMQDLEFTVEEGKLWMLQTRNGKRTGEAMVRIGMEMLNEGMIDQHTALLRMDPAKLNELLHPVFDQITMKGAKLITTGLAASPGAATGKICFFPDDAHQMNEAGQEVILVRIETSADDLEGMDAANGILTARGGMTSHAAVVARGMGKCCVSGAGTLHINYQRREMEVNGMIYREGDWISLNGSTGEVFEGRLETTRPKLSTEFQQLMKLVESNSVLRVRANADTPESARIARSFGAVGIGLCRTEHMFFEGDRINAMREMIVASDQKKRETALNKLLPMQRKDFEGIFEAMENLPVTIRLLDPPLHEFVPKEEKAQNELAGEMDIDVAALREKIEKLQEVNPMLGHRGCRLGNTYPEITRMQARAILEAALNLKQRGIVALPEIMVPLTGTLEEMEMQGEIIKTVAESVFSERNDKIDFKVGTMIEVPRAALVASEIAKSAEFFSFGTNDLTQMTYGYSRDDAGKFLPIYLENGLLKTNPFETIDRDGVGQLIEISIDRGRKTRPDIKIGLCGEHGGDPDSVQYCHSLGMDYVSCSPFRVPVARLAAARAAVKDWKVQQNGNGSEH